MRSITAGEAATATGLHVETIRGYLRSGRIPATKVGRIYIIEPEVLRPLVAERPRRGRPPRDR